MPVATLCASHSPLKDYFSPGPEIEDAVAACFREVEAWVADYAPELVVVIGPDHFNGFFYHLMPSFCVGAAAEAVGDWKTPNGPYSVDAAIATACVTHMHAHGVDAALSHQMVVDHGGIQILDQLFDWQALPPILPIFVNCAAPPLPPLQRTVAFGRALGEYVAQLERRVLVIGSGGLSHDPPIPQLEGALPEVRQRLIEGGRLSPDARAARQERVLTDASRQVDGSSERTPLNPAWDQRFLDLLIAQDFDQICAMDDASITRNGGCGGHEIRAWIAATAASLATHSRQPKLHFYQAIPQWVAGYAVMTVAPG